MTNTTTTIPSDTTYQAEPTGTHRPVRTVAGAAAGIAAVFALGWLAASVVIDTDGSTVVPAVPAAAVAAPVRPAMSPDAIDRWAEQTEAVPATPTVSPDAAERAALAQAVPATPTVSPDAAERAALAQAVPATPTVSPDAAERAALAEAARQERIDEAACARASEGQADC